MRLPQGLFWAWGLLVIGLEIQVRRLRLNSALVNERRVFLDLGSAGPAPRLSHLGRPQRPRDIAATSRGLGGSCYPLGTLRGMWRANAAWRWPEFSAIPPPTPVQRRTGRSSAPWLFFGGVPTKGREKGFKLMSLEGVPTHAQHGAVHDFKKLP